MILLDSSIWISYLRNPSQKKYKAQMENFVVKPLQNLEMALCGIILFELLQGAKTHQQRLDIARIEEVCEYFDLSQEDYYHAAILSQRSIADNHGISMADLLIATCASKHKLTLVSADRAFLYLSQIDPQLKVEFF